MDEFHEVNRAYWDELAVAHPDTDHYDVEGFLDGESTLRDIERRELDDVVGEETDLLHLQCHFGLDTLSWARHGANVVGVDFSGEAIGYARELAIKSGLDDQAEFIECDIYDLPEHLEQQFDVVFATYGVTAWLSDFDRWAEIAASYVAPGGTFYLAEGHPVGKIFGDIDGERATIRRSYFTNDTMKQSVEASYAGDVDICSDVAYEWLYTVGDIVSAVAASGLIIEYFHEFPKLTFHHFEKMEADEDGWWRFSDGPEIPLTYSIRAHKPPETA